MSQTAPVPHAQNQIIIVKRGGGGEDGHHGGAWKIAFADFMTAMMAFFLVMWLTSVSDEATKKQIAQYFNPIKLNSASPETLGLQDGTNTPSKPAPASQGGEVKDGGNPDEKPMSGAESGGEEQALFRDPYAVLAEIAAEGGQGVRDGVAGVPDGSGLPGLNGGEAYRDPFDPTSWQLSPNAEVKAPEDTDLKSTEFATADGLPATTVTEVVPPIPEAKPAEPAEPDVPALSKAEADAAALKAEIEKSIAGASPGSAPGIEVKAGEGGITISLADSLTSGMFEIGSAKPTAQAVALVETIAKLLGEREGQVVVRGHTDSRPYAGEEYDNWRLSAARAQFAYYMLVRGGLDEKRVTSIEGFADRQPKDAANPESAVNRRIEILLKEPAA
ncbi:MAG: OmpA family protein [Rhizobiaceae bacterium]|nr:OmpA family protein [Rhizobiaceae bacterium]